MDLSFVKVLNSRALKIRNYHRSLTKHCMYAWNPMAKMYGTFKININTDILTDWWLKKEGGQIQTIIWSSYLIVIRYYNYFIKS